jgi:hypothetical protein
MHLTPPFPCCYARHKPVSVAATWLFQCQLMTMQFVMMKPILTALPFILRLSRTLDYDGRPPILNNTINPYSPKLYIQVHVHPTPSCESVSLESPILSQGLPNICLTVFLSVCVSLSLSVCGCL